MCILDIRRHAQRMKPSQNLSSQGKKLAQSTVNQNFKYDWVATSGLGRADESAVAMGQNVNQRIEALGFLPRDIFDRVGWPANLDIVASVIKNHDDISGYASRQASIWRKIASRLTQNQHALIISHGIIAELGMVASLPNVNHSTWGKAIGYCEGMRLFFDGNKFSHCEMLRVADKDYMVSN